MHYRTLLLHGLSCELPLEKNKFAKNKKYINLFENDANLLGKTNHRPISNLLISKIEQLFELENCIITPHVAWASKQAREKLMDMTVENILCFLEGRPFNNLAK